TAPAYGLSEERIGKAIGHRRSEFVLCTKVGERFEDGQSTYDYSATSVRSSIERSLRLLRADHVDIVLVHSNGEDERILNHTDVLNVLNLMKDKGLIKCVGFSGKTIEGARMAMRRVQILMTAFNKEDQSHANVIQEAQGTGVGVLIKKGLASGHLSATDAIPFLLENQGISSVVIGGLSIDHVRANIRIAEETERA
ncbi:MAG TPA: aldo/keto reductase, partial [Phycisphaerales bacterium]|nr:aldo/keto reductase [Phycisphaerales bacterium]